MRFGLSSAQWRFRNRFLLKLRMSSQRIDRPILNSIYSMYGYMRVLPALWWGNEIRFVDVYLTYLFILGYGRYDEFLRAPIRLVLPAALDRGLHP
jgi:hypothetical protein